MAYKLYLSKIDGTTANISGLVGNIAWNSNIDTLGEELTFDYMYSDTQYFSQFDILEYGDQITFINDDVTINNFIIVDVKTNSRFKKGITCYDRAWYLNKNMTVIQFNKSSVTNCIEKLLDKFNINHNIASIPALVTKIYKESVLSDIIKELLEQATAETGNKYRLEMDKDTVIVRKQEDMLINPYIKLTDNTSEFPVTLTISNPNKEESIADLKNSVIVASSDDSSAVIYATSEDADSISKYGLLTEVLTVDGKNESQARNIAKNKLAELNTVKQTLSFEMLGHDDIKAGRLIQLNEPITGIVGTFLIKSANHTLNNAIHKVSVELEVT